jgi:cell wall-associated NlpC family hydrolase
VAQSASEPVVLPPDSLAKDSKVERIDTGNLLVSKVVIRTGKVQPQEIVEYAKTLIGTKYQYGSTDPAVGFDCSGFITYVFRHFNIQVPRSSIDFTEVGRTADLDSVRPGDLILFTGTDSTERHIGHMGIITSNQGGVVEFIHSTSGKQYGVTITPLSRYYLGRFMRVARIFPQNE